ncbi:arsenite methyltransferase [Sinanaerobacter chloroacetimidivorans]|uniref:Arsenite methyltransferase n=1 Tax=Sinanaerobacter chloroacetimidivorans TaxID=2818044 RepID=A0A8J7W0W3_9FIRM|nr:arsenite methyltransferase [Sinanaerobacter chloroacetimidivorans]MBR0598754.1 arsenite methyltransferase [Sinanaerobacter chloroacetimidivorans]
MGNKEEVRNFIRKNYANVALKGSNGGCCSGGCCCGGDSFDINEASARIGYTEENLSNIPADANMGLGCGNPLAIVSLKKGETVLDLGSGGGFDCFLAREQVGEQGYVIGVDMTPEMVSLARKNAEESGFTNIDFRLGEIEHLPVLNESIDVIISNCVINLSLDKEQVFKEAFRVLKSGGRMSLSDIVITSELPQNVKENLALTASCISGAESVENLESMLYKAGFQHVKMTPKLNSKEIIRNWNLGNHLEDFVASYLIEAEK